MAVTSDTNVPEELNKIVTLEGAVTLETAEAATGTLGKKPRKLYFAIIDPDSFGKREISPGINPQPFPKVRLEIPEATYEALEKQRGDGTAFGKVTINLYTRTIHYTD